MDNELAWPLSKQPIYQLAIADIELDVLKRAALTFQAVPVGSRITLWAEEIGPHVVVDANDGEAELIEKRHGFRTD